MSERDYEEQKISDGSTENLKNLGHNNARIEGINDKKLPKNSPQHDIKNTEQNNEIQENFCVKIPGKFSHFRGENFPETHSQNEKEFVFKEIIRIIDPHPILAAYQITSILRLAMKYILPIHKSLAIFLSEPILRRLQKNNFPLHNLADLENSNSDI